MSTRRRAVRAVAGGAGTTVLLALLAWSSATPLPFHGSSSARLRLSWSARPERIEVCRTLSDEELAKRPEHMRRRLECDGRFATYALRVEVDERTFGEAVIHGGGLRHDRPIFLLREFAVPSGAHRIRITFSRRESVERPEERGEHVSAASADTGLYAGRTEREITERARRMSAAIPAHVELDTSVTLGPRTVALVRLNADRKVFELRTAPGQAP